MIGVIGLGRMGQAMALRLLAKGERVLGFDLASEMRERSAVAGIPVAGSATEVADSCRTVVLSLPNVEAVRSVTEGLLAQLARGSMIVDTSTIDPETAVTLATTAEQRELLFVDAPVSGGVPAARSGTLVAMVGGASRAYDRASAVLDHLASDCHHVGPAGSGQVVKICQQLLAFGEVAMLAEAMAVAERAGVDRGTVADVVRRSSAGSPILNTYGDKLAARAAAEVTYSVTDVLKDQTLYTALARSRGIAPELGDAVETLFRAAAEADFRSADASAIARVAGRRVPPPPR